MNIVYSIKHWWFRVQILHRPVAAAALKENEKQTGDEIPKANLVQQKGCYG